MRMTSSVQKLQDWFQHPVSLLNNVSDKWLFITFTSSFIFIFLLVFQPFGVNNYDPTHQISAEFLSGMALFSLSLWFVMALNTFVFQAVFFNLKTRGSLLGWTLWTFLFISSFSFLFYNLLGNFHDWLFKSYLGFIRDISNLMSLPFFMSYLFIHYRQIKAQFQKASNTSGLSDQFLHFRSENEKEALILHPNQLLYIEAQENYIAVYYLQDGQTKKELIRSSLKRLEQQFEKGFLLRCHRSFMVNLSQIYQIKVRYQKLTLLLHQGQVEVPVSRKYQQAIKAKLSPDHSSLRASIYPKAL